MSVFVASRAQISARAMRRHTPDTLFQSTGYIFLPAGRASRMAQIFIPGHSRRAPPLLARVPACSRILLLSTSTRLWADNCKKREQPGTGNRLPLRWKNRLRRFERHWPLAMVATRPIQCPAILSCAERDRDGCICRECPTIQCRRFRSRSGHACSIRVAIDGTSLNSAGR
jgi:hypothetical protein